jgi:carboxyl-terminal processing protease
MSRTVRNVVFTLLILALFAGLLVPLLWSVFSPPASTGLDLVQEAWDTIIDNYVDSGDIDTGELSEGAIRGMIEALDDPYSAYYDAEHYRMVQSNLEGRFGGIGAEVTISDGKVTVIAPVKGAPAEQAGVLPGDIILKVDGKSVEGMTLDDAVIRMRGDPGTEVTVTVLHKGDEEPVDITMTREVIVVETVYPEMLDDGIAYVELTRFSTRTGEEFVSALAELLAGDPVGIVLDLRGNPGGALAAAVTVASQFLDGGIVLYSIDNSGARNDYPVESGGLAPDMPLVVLVNEGSASASEVVAGALQGRERAVLVGNTTFGKGSIGLDFQLSDRSAIRLTIQRWYTPDGRLIEGEGIEPDEPIEMTQDDVDAGRDPQLDRAVEYLKGQA